MKDNNKIRLNAEYLGLAPCQINNTKKRSAVRKLLNGLGFSTADYIDLTMGELEEIYNGLLTSVGGPLMKIKNITNEMRSTAIVDFQEAVKGIAVPVKGQEQIQEAAKPVQAAKPLEQAISPEQALQALMGLMKGNTKPDENAVLEIVRREMAAYSKPLPVVVEIKEAGKTRKVEGLHHYQLPRLIKKAAIGTNLMLVGPAGSGKTTLAHQMATALEVEFYFNGAISSEYKLTGFIDAQGRIVSTAFRKAYETGGLYLFDEIDASMPDALLAFNAALANGHMDFPDGTVKRHENFYCVAAANTFGKGADRVYVGRNQLDAASLNRFAMINIDYDEKLEKALACNDDWVEKVQSIRKAVYEHKIRHVVSPRASIEGAKWLAHNISEKEVLEELVYQGLDVDSVKKIKASI